MTQSSIIKIKKIKDDRISIKLDENLNHLLGIAYGFHKKVIESTSKAEGKIYQETFVFNNLIDKLTNQETKETELNLEEIKTLYNWIECICQMMIEMDTINLKHKNIKKFFKLAQNFIKKTTKYKSQPTIEIFN